MLDLVGIRGMSTRKGTAVFLKDILDECRDIMINRQIESPTTKVPINDGNTADILGVSCVIINDLKQRRQKDYEFDWDRVLQKKNSGAVAARECIPEILEHPEVLFLVKELAKFHDVLYRANEQLEAHILVNYLFHLCNHISENPDVASQRLLLFNTARGVLRNGMSILGI
ncbi:hypothetical protein NQ317_005866 [Molorchus minor]|uniref:Probable arginine--tRNA ligase, mitochondrial n=1 Tax=Molorchus minor TaxID=1323400 RepID=A0ABQ9IWJ8_9CUCU|nr:hypothetical protein NQ317_005866 [Molorchus minor]